MSNTLNANGIKIRINTVKNEDYISLTDIAKKCNPDQPNIVIQNWLRNRNTIEFLGLWEKLNNPTFKPLEFEGFRKQAGLNAFVLSPKKWINSTGSIGITAKSGRYGGTYAHTDIAFEFASWISPEFKLYIIKDYQRLKNDESRRKQLGWNVKRELAKVNYRIQTDAIKENLVPEYVSSSEKNIIYSSEADILNMAVFGITAKQWRLKNPSLTGNIRDYAEIIQLVLIANLESINAILINAGLSQEDRIIHLNKIARQQLKTLINSSSLKNIEKLNQ